jgi:tRNA pseudouridine32 synthase/23S rRNA pseudouridine746 synthase
MERLWSPSLPPLLAEGDDWLVLDKPAGLAVHPGPRTFDSLEGRLATAGVAASPVHRLDRDTSGCLLLARRPAALRRLQAAFASRDVEKVYWAIVVNPPERDEGRIDAPLLKISSKAKGWRMIVDPGGKPAVTGWKVLARRGGLALMAFRPETGRTHQLRVHATLMSKGAHILGDVVYGQPAPGGLALHARALAFPDRDRARAQALAPVPERFRELGFAMEE